ncbi:hypothetical protein [Sphingobium sp. KCTC 72723]|uniref:hypothetical protein n=1 Tax=Sphingobium sp. KCTC 72723 TaxID=2733867 RepID=UPI00165E45FF|nr:hypothetical protein [Sphingobium sp. KCTC 72723]
MKRASLEQLTLIYALTYIPNIALTKWLATRANADLGRPLTGLELLPSTIILSALMTYAFIWLSGWWRDAHQVKVGRFSLPCPTRWTILSGIGTSLVLFTVPLSFTFVGVSIPFIQLLMRGDLLIIAPLVDLINGRKVRWYSWAALLLCGVGLTLTISQRGGLNLPPIAIATILLYTLGYFIRLAVMTRTAKDEIEGSARRYFVEEKIVALPLAVLALAAMSWLGLGAQGDQLRWGFVTVWGSDQLGYIAMIGFTAFLVSIFSAMILLSKHENSYCVPLERSASILAGLVAAAILGATIGTPMPTGAELAGAGLLIVAIILLSVGPRLKQRDAGAAHILAVDPDAGVPPVR